MGGAPAAAAAPATVLLCLVSPAWSFFFLFFTSLMLLEKRGDKKWGKVLPQPPQPPTLKAFCRATICLCPPQLWWSLSAPGCALAGR